MATMDDVLRYIVNQGGVLGTKTGDTFNLKFPVGGNRYQSLLCIKHDNLELVTFATPFASKSTISAEQALKAGVIFGVMDVGNFYAFVTTVALQTLDQLEVDVILHLMVKLADELEKGTTGVDLL